MKVAVVGCSHGELDKIYDIILKAQEREKIKIDLLLCCGDFEAIRNEEDLACMKCPQKYKVIKSFYKYYSGEKKAPVLTVFVGGNHEASNYLWELSYGGWVAPNFYYLGNAGVVNFAGVRIGGLSGIYDERHYQKNHFEAPPYNWSTMSSAYHIRSCDVFRLKQMSKHIDIMLSHDWPLGIYHHGDIEELIQTKQHLKDQIYKDTLGSPPMMELLQHLKPSYWFSAHLHVKFAAIYFHNECHDSNKKCTKFLALDKILPRRKFMQIIDIEPTVQTSERTTFQLEYDPEWLSILRSTECHMRYYADQLPWLPPSSPSNETCSFTPGESELDEIRQLFNDDLTIPENFEQTVVPHDPTKRIDYHPVVCGRENPQTTELCRKLHIKNPFIPTRRERPTTTIGAHNIEEHSDSDVQVAGAIGHDESIKLEGDNLSMSDCTHLTCDT